MESPETNTTTPLKEAIKAVHKGEAAPSQSELVCSSIQKNYFFVLGATQALGIPHAGAFVDRLAAEVEQAERDSRKNKLIAEDVQRDNDTLRAQLETAKAALAERDGLFQMFIDNSDDGDVVELSRHILSASAEPAAVSQKSEGE